MKIVNKPQRQSITIEFTPDEQDALFTLAGNIRGGGPVRLVTDGLYKVLEGVPVEDLGYESYKDLKFH